MSRVRLLAAASSCVLLAAHAVQPAPATPGPAGHPARCDARR